MGFVCAYLNASCGVFLCLLLPFWSAFAICGGLFLLIFTVIYIIRHFFETQLFSWRARSCSLRDWWSEFPDNMQDFYNDRKIVDWLELYNLKHPKNNIGLPPQQISLVSGEAKNAGQDKPNVDVAGKNDIVTENSVDSANKDKV